MTTRTPAARYNKRRSDEGDDLERYAVPAALEPDGYELGRSHLSRGPFDWLALKTGQILVISSRLTAATRATPSLSYAEASTIWAIVERLAAPGVEVLGIVATAEHAPRRRLDGSWAPCRCEPKVPVEQLLGADGEPVVRFLRMTAAPVAGQGRRPSYEPWTPDFARPAAGEVVALEDVA